MPPLSVPAFSVTGRTPVRWETIARQYFATAEISRKVLLHLYLDNRNHAKWRQYTSCSSRREANGRSGLLPSSVITRCSRHDITIGVRRVARPLVEAQLLASASAPSRNNGETDGVEKWRGKKQEKNEFSFVVPLFFSPSGSSAIFTESGKPMKSATPRRLG